MEKNKHNQVLTATLFTVLACSMGIAGISQNVGIGTTVPVAKLHVYQLDGNTKMVVQSVPNNTFSASELHTANGVSDFSRYGSNAGGTIAGISANNATRLWSGFGRMVMGTGTADPIHFATAATERMVITGAGNVGIGVASPTAKLEIDAGTFSETSFRLKSSSDFGIRQWFMMGNDLNTALAIARFGPGINGNLFGLSTQNLSAIFTSDLGVNALAMGTKNNIPLVFGTNNVERLKILGDGTVSINAPASTVSQVSIVSNDMPNGLTVSNWSEPPVGNYSNAIIGKVVGTGVGKVGVHGQVLSSTGTSAGIINGLYGLLGTANEAGFGLGVYASNNAHGIYSQIMSGTGKALTTVGPIQLAGIGEKLGAFLGSDANGNASWMDLPEGSTLWRKLGTDIINNNPTGNIAINTPAGYSNFNTKLTVVGSVDEIHIAGIDQYQNYPEGAIAGISRNTFGGAGVYGISHARRNSVRYWAGVTGVNYGSGSDRYGVAGYAAGTASGAATPVAGVGGFGEYGVYGLGSNAGVLAQHETGGAALELKNGFIKVTGTNKTAFKHTTGLGNISGNYSYLTYATPDESDIVIVTHNYTPTATYLNKAVGVFWDAGNSRWCIYNEDLSAMPVNITFNVLVIKQ